MVGVKKVKLSLSSVAMQETSLYHANLQVINCITYLFYNIILNYLLLIFLAYATKENKSRLVEKTADGSTRLKQAIKLDLSEHLKIVKSEKLVINVVPNYKGVILVTPTDVRNVVESAGVMLDRKAIILLENPITTAGSHKVSIDGNELTIEVVVNDL